MILANLLHLLKFNRNLYQKRVAVCGQQEETEHIAVCILHFSFFICLSLLFFQDKDLVCMECIDKVTETINEIIAVIIASYEMSSQNFIEIRQQKINKMNTVGELEKNILLSEASIKACICQVPRIIRLAANLIESVI